LNKDIKKYIFKKLCFPRRLRYGNTKNIDFFFMREYNNKQIRELMVKIMRNKCLIIITGDLAAGKTTYGMKIAEKLKIPFFSKEKIYEIFLKYMNNGDLDYEAKCYSVLYIIVEELMKAERTFILECNFVKESVPILDSFIKKYDYKCLTVRFKEKSDSLKEFKLNNQEIVIDTTKVNLDEIIDYITKI